MRLTTLNTSRNKYSSFDFLISTEVGATALFFFFRNLEGFFVEVMKKKIAVKAAQQW